MLHFFKQNSGTKIGEMKKQSISKIANIDVSKPISANNRRNEAVHWMLESYDPLFTDAARIVVDKEKASIGMLQRYLKIGFNRAARIMDELEAEGIVGPEMGTKPRDVLMTPEEFETLLETMPEYPIREGNINREETIVRKEYVPPTMELLNDVKKNPISEIMLREQAEKIEQCFMIHGYSAHIVDIRSRVRFISYTIRYADVVPYKKLKEINEDIEFYLSSEAMFESVVDKTNTLIFKVKVNNPGITNFKELLTLGANQDGLIIGSDGMNSAVIYDYKKDVHLLIGGTTGSGKSSLLDMIMMNIIYKFSPSEARTVLVDTSGIQLNAYYSVPHLLLPVIKDVKKAVNLFYWLDSEIKERLETLARQGINSIHRYEQLNKNSDSAMPRIFVIIDDVGDILLHDPDAERLLNDIIRNGRATGVHLIVVTQKPTVGAVGTFVKSNISARIAFRTASIKDSQIIIDEPGAESIAEEGMFLYKKFGEKEVITGYAGHSDLNEINRVVGYLRNH